MSMVYYTILILMANASYFAKVCFSFYACEILIWRLLNLLLQPPVASSKSVIEKQTTTTTTTWASRGERKCFWLRCCWWQVGQLSSWRLAFCQFDAVYSLDGTASETYVCVCNPNEFVCYQRSLTGLTRANAAQLDQFTSLSESQS